MVASPNPNKFSKHLTVKNCYFDDWIKMSKVFYKLFCIIWDEKYLWIKSHHLIDMQIVRNKASLRMVGSSKLDGKALKFDNDKHVLTDSLIRIYQKKLREAEQLVTKAHIKDAVFDNVIAYSSIDDPSSSNNSPSSSVRIPNLSSPQLKPSHDVSS